MNKKLLAALVTVVMAGTCAAGLAACDTDKGGNGHTHDYDGVVYTSDGNGRTHSKKCKVDGCNAATGTEEHNDWETDETAATCTTAKVVKYTCKDCGYEKTETVGEAAGHVWDEWTVEKKPTAETEGKATRSCNVTGCSGESSHQEVTLPVLDSSDYTLTNDTATCAATGTATYTYNKDGKTVSFSAESPVNANNHTYDTSKWVSNGTEHWHAANCGHNEVDNVLNTSDAADHEISADGYCTVCYTTSLSTIQNKFKFVAGNGVKFTAFVYGMSGVAYDFTYVGTEDVNIEYGGYSDQGVFSSQTATLSNGNTFKLTLTGNQDVIIITSDSAEQVTGAIQRLAELGENDAGYPVTASKEGELYIFTADGSGEFSYVMTADDDKAEIYTDGENGRELVTLPYKFKLSSGAKKNFYMSYAGDDVVAGYNVAIDREWDLGTEMKPKKVELGVDLTETVSSAFYYSFHPTENGWYRISSTTANAVLSSGDVTYGGLGSGFDCFVRVTAFEEGSEFNKDIYQSFQLSSLGGAEISCDFKIEKVDGATALELDTAKTGNNVYTFTASFDGKDYMLTVSELPASGYWTIIYENSGLKTILNVTSTRAIISPTAGTAFTVIYGNTSGSVTLNEDDSALQISLGVSAKATANSTRYFRVPADGTYTFTTSLAAQWFNSGNYWKVNDELYTTATVTLEDLKEDDVVTIQFASWGSTTVTILPENSAQITAGDSANITVNKDGQTFIYATGTAGVIYPVSLSGEGVQFVGGGTVKEITADANGNIKAFVEYTGEGDSAEATVTVHSLTITEVTDTPVTVDNISKKVLIYAGKANITYTLTLTGEGVQFVGGGTSKDVTADENGYVYALVECTGSGESATATVTIEQVPYELQLNTDYGNGQLAAKVVYSFTATEAGDYVISGFKVYGASRSITVNGVEHKYTDATSGTAVTSFTVENVASGETVTFAISSITSAMTIRVDAPASAE